MLKIKDNIDLKELEKYLIKLNIMDDNECAYSNVYCAIHKKDIDEIKNNCIDDYNVMFFINENNEIDYCTYSEMIDFEFVLDKVYDLIKADLVEKVGE